MTAGRIKSATLAEIASMRERGELAPVRPHAGWILGRRPDRRAQSAAGRQSPERGSYTMTFNARISISEDGGRRVEFSTAKLDAAATAT